MEDYIYICKYTNCRTCTEKIEHGFKYVEVKTGEKYTFAATDTFTILFIIKGEALISCNEFRNVPFKEQEIAVWSINSNSVLVAETDITFIVLNGDNNIIIFDENALKDYEEKWLYTIPEFKGLAIKPQLMTCLHSVKNFLNDKISCPYMHRVKQRELSLIFRSYYSIEELAEIFIPVVCNTDDFKVFIMNNYLNMKGVKEFVDLSGMNISTFNRKFKAHFNESPYQWLIKQKSKHVYHALSATNKRISDISREFHFSDASHFNRYCKTMFGASPSKIRDRHLSKYANTKPYNIPPVTSQTDKTQLL